MKRFPLLILSLFFLLKTPSAAQEFNWNYYQENYNKTTTAFSLGNGKWLVGTKAISDNLSSINLGVIHLVDSKGSLWRDSNANRISGNFQVKSFLRFGDKIFVLIRTNNFSYILSYWLKEDSLEFIDILALEYRILIDKIELLPNGKIIGIGSDLRTSFSYGYWTVISQNLIQEYEDFSYLGKLSDLILLDDSTFLLGGIIADTIDYGMKKIDLDYNQLESFLPDFFFSRSLLTDNKDIFITNGRRINKLNSSFEIDTTIFLSNIETLIDFKIDGNKLYAFGVDDNIPTIFEFDDNLSLVDSHIIDIPNFSPGNIDIQNDTFIIVGKHNLPLSSIPGLTDEFPQFTASFYSFVKNEDLNFVNNNLEIEDVQVHRFKQIKDCAPPHNKYNLSMEIVEIHLVNKGEIPIEEFNIFIRAVGLKNCIDYNPHRKFYKKKKRVSNIMLMPGDSLTVIIQDMKFPQFVLDSAAVNLCVWVNTVNQKIDIDMSDNKICGDFDLIQTEYVEIPIASPEENELLIYPNPSSNRIAVSLKTAPFESSLIEFFDMIGRRMQFNFIAPRATFKEIDISNLPDGIYFVRVKNDLVEETTRFFKN